MERGRDCCGREGGRLGHLLCQKASVRTVSSGVQICYSSRSSSHWKLHQSKHHADMIWLQWHIVVSREVRVKQHLMQPAASLALAFIPPCCLVLRSLLAGRAALCKPSVFLSLFGLCLPCDACNWQATILDQQRPERHKKCLPESWGWSKHS